jgi:large subunit ribosomal protein L6
MKVVKYYVTCARGNGMSRIERSPLSIPAGVDVTVKGQHISVKGKKGSLEKQVDSSVKMIKEDSLVRFSPVANVDAALAIAGTTRALVKNMLFGVSEGFQRKLLLEGVGYRAQVAGDVLNLSVGFSHPIKYKLPKGVLAETPSQTEIILKGVDNELLGQVAATIRNFQPPEPYKGKGIRYSAEVIVYKEGKKK